MKVITYRITLREPTLVTAPGGDPNGATALAYLPGGVLRGALVGKHLQQRRQSDSSYQLDAADPEVRKLFFDGTTRYLNGYLLVGEERSLPAPLSWHREKGEPSPLRDFAVEDIPENDSRQWRGVPGKFWAPAGTGAGRLVAPLRHLAVHTARNRRLGRPQEPALARPGEDPGAVYRYDALAAGQTFSAAILCEDAAPLLPLLNGTLVLGGSRNGGYGSAVIESADEKDVSWRETGEVEGPAPEGLLIVTLLSDALLRDAGGQFVADANVVARAIAERLNVERLERRDAFLRGTIVGGFNRKWGLPLPQASAVAMGSVFAFERPACPAERLQLLEAQGIGERRAEGFGRVAIDAHVRKKWDVVESSERATGSRVRLDPETESGKVARGMAERLFRQRLEVGLAARAQELARNVTRPSRSQLARLRLVLQDALRQPPADGRQRLRRYLDDLQNRQAARKQFARDRIGTQPLLEWLRQRVDDASEVWNVLQAPRTEVGGIGVERTDQMAYEYNLRLVDAVLARAAKERTKEDR